MKRCVRRTIRLMDEKARRFRPLRFGLADLFSVVAVSAIVAALWSPFPKRLTIDDFLEVKHGTSSDSVIKHFGQPHDSFLVSRLTAFCYGVDANDVWMYFENDALYGNSVKTRDMMRPKRLSPFVSSSINAPSLGSVTLSVVTRAAAKAPGETPLPPSG
jgi:hypothetical protein